MDLDRFLDEVDESIGRLHPQELAWGVHEIARMQPEELREKFLRVLRSAGELPSDEVSRAEKLLEDINDGELRIRADRGWYDEPDYSDPEGVMDEITEVVRLVHRLVEEGEYASALKLGQDLISLEISRNNGLGVDSLDIKRAYEAMDIDFSEELQNLALETMLCAYRCSPSPAQDIYRVLTSPAVSGLSLKDLFQFAHVDPRDQAAFLDAWVDWLGKLTGPQPDRLYDEALSLLPDQKERLEKVKAFAVTHPEKYLALLTDPEIPVEERFQMGMDALARLDVRSPVRPEIALDTAQFSLLTNQSADVTEFCWMEAFASSPTPTGYLRVLLNCRDQKSRKEEMERLADAYFASEGKNPGMEQYNLGLQFLRGNFMELFRSYLEISDYRDWTSTFVKGGIALYLALLYRENTPTYSIRAMLNTGSRGLGFREEVYRRGLPASDSGDDRFSFPAVFEQWKKTVVLPDSDETEEILASIEKSMEIRVNFMNLSYGSSIYEECAEFLGALGDVHESLGHTGEKQRILTACARKYPHRKNLLSELIGVGWEE